MQPRKKFLEPSTLCLYKGDQAVETMNDRKLLARLPIQVWKFKRHMKVTQKVADSNPVDTLLKEDEL